MIVEREFWAQVTAALAHVADTCAALTERRAACTHARTHARRGSADRIRAAVTPSAAPRRAALRCGHLKSTAAVGRSLGRAALQRQRRIFGCNIVRSFVATSVRRCCSRWPNTLGSARRTRRSRAVHHCVTAAPTCAVTAALHLSAAAACSVGNGWLRRTLHAAVCCCMLPYGVACFWFCTLAYGVACCRMLLHAAVWCCMLPYGVVGCMLHVMRCTALRCTA